MARGTEASVEASVVERDDLSDLPRILRDDGWIVVAPVVRDGAIVLDEIEELSELPVGWTAEQEPGSYRLRRREDQALFGFTVGPHSPKGRLHPPDALVFRAHRKRGDLAIASADDPSPKIAFLGLRACDLAAIARQDRVLLEGPVADPIYASRRADCFRIAVQCLEAAATCFCASVGTGPRAREGFDLALTELIDADGHRFLVEPGSEAGRAVLGRLRTRPARPQEVQAADAAAERTARSMQRSIDPEGARDLLRESAGSRVWEEVAERCLGCANCTMVCPTCFCTTVEDVTDLSGEHAERWQRWDSCFTFQFSHLSGGVVRSSTAARYRHWLTHKLASWWDQFESSGCVGCGRCITWCPVGIDLTEELSRIARARDDASPQPSPQEPGS